MNSKNYQSSTIPHIYIINTKKPNKLLKYILCSNYKIDTFITNIGKKNQITQFICRSTTLIILELKLNAIFSNNKKKRFQNSRKQKKESHNFKYYM